MVVTLSQQNGQWVARELTPEELNNHGESIDRMEVFLAKRSVNSWILSDKPVRFLHHLRHVQRNLKMSAL